jgi:uroporphyrinogen-III synthase
MRVLVTRPKEDARRFAAALVARGHQVLLEPLLSVEFLPPEEAPMDLTGIQALLFTSANGVRAFAARTALRDVPVYTVGDASAHAALEAGFADVHSAAGDVVALARLVEAQLEPRKGPLFHAAAGIVAGDLQGRLNASGFAVRRCILYRTVEVDRLTNGTFDALSKGTVDVVTFFSPRTAETFVKLVEEMGISGALSHTRAACLSAAVAAKLKNLPWAGLIIADRPDQDALIACL